jgi:DeoR/GlpR family transcriptional regulator of sugar metabolism
MNAKSLYAGHHRLALTRRIAHTLKLLQAGKAVYKSELMRVFGVDAKTIQRDMQALMEFFPIRKEQGGRQVRYVLDTETGWRELLRDNCTTVNRSSLKPT